MGQPQCPRPVAAGGVTMTGRVDSPEERVQGLLIYKHVSCGFWYPKPVMRILRALLTTFYGMIKGGIRHRLLL